MHGETTVGLDQPKGACHTPTLDIFQFRWKAIQTMTTISLDNTEPPMALPEGPRYYYLLTKPSHRWRKPEGLRYHYGGGAEASMGVVFIDQDC
jgi:hypothetical protein